MKTLLMFSILFCLPVMAQEIPDVPSQVQTCQNGQPYKTGKLATLIGSCPFDKKPEPKALTWKQTFDWKYFTMEGIYLAAMLKDQQDTLNGEKMGCALEEGDPFPYYATRGDLMKKNLPYFAGVSVTSALLKKVHFPAWFVLQIAAAGVHAKGSYDWHQVCH